MGVLSINRKRFLVTMGAGYALLAAVLVTLLLTGTVFAAFPLSGIGGFVVAADKIVGEGFKLVPTIGDTSERSVWPQGAVTLDSVTISGLTLTKEIDTGDLAGLVGGIEKVVVEISANGRVNGEGVTMHISGMTADRAVFTNMTIDEKYSVIPLGKVDLEAPTLDLTNAELNTHTLMTRSISLPGMKLKIKAFREGKLIGGDF